MHTIVQRPVGSAWCCVRTRSLAVILLCAISASAQPNPFEAILTRNVFGLVPVPPAAPPPEPPLPKFTLTGITTVIGPARALLKMAAAPGTANPGGERFFNLKAGERDGELELLEINEKSRTVVIVYSGRRLTVGFEPEKPNPAPSTILNPTHVSAMQESSPPPLPGAIAMTAQDREERALMHEATRADVQQRIQARIGASRTGGTASINGQ